MCAFEVIFQRYLSKYRQTHGTTPPHTLPLFHSHPPNSFPLSWVVPRIFIRMKPTWQRQTFSYLSVGILYMTLFIPLVVLRFHWYVFWSPSAIPTHFFCVIQMDLHMWWILSCVIETRDPKEQPNPTQTLLILLKETLLKWWWCNSTITVKAIDGRRLTIDDQRSTISVVIVVTTIVRHTDDEIVCSTIPLVLPTTKIAIPYWWLSVPDSFRNLLRQVSVFPKLRWNFFHWTPYCKVGMLKYSFSFSFVVYILLSSSRY